MSLREKTSAASFSTTPMHRSERSLLRVVPFPGTRGPPAVRRFRGYSVSSLFDFITRKGAVFTGFECHRLGNRQLSGNNAETANLSLECVSI
ncbi:hypothetical protein F2P81_001602 [Scophthalmus maximus]|uniref:Uncharacterized protein n=1 Tax=Scophthalmus maximus TaxID=52904 RepID=A0A6A4TGJ7_SCOMX|nr:hypothetical protein F2P81_001602 [Scophthalmus maximus]